MTELVERIEHVVTQSVLHQQARQRRRRSVVLASGVVLSFLVTAGAGVAMVSDTPIDRLLASDDPVVGHNPRGSRIDVTVVDARGLGWTSTTYVTRDGRYAGTLVPEGYRDGLPPVGARVGL
jgi:hypothetical protein